VAPFPTGALLYNAGDPADSVLIVRTGQVKVSRRKADGRSVILWLAGPGDIVGAELFSGSTYTTTARAVAETAICSIKRDRFLETLENASGLTSAFASHMAILLRRMEERLLHVGLKGASRRLAVLLTQLARLDLRTVVEPHRFQLFLKRQEIAAMIGVVPETTSRLLATFVRAGVLSLSGRWIDIVDPVRLVEFAATGRWTSHDKGRPKPEQGE